MEWKAEIWIKEVPVQGCEDFTQVEMNDIIKKACKVINQEYREVVKVIDFDVHVEKEEE